jgi:hypothetical protein
MARTAVVAGTATATVGAVSGAQQRRTAAAAQQQAAQEATQQAAFESQQKVAEMQAQLAEMQAQQAIEAMTPPATAASDFMAHLNQLAQLKAQGMLSDEEFAAAKAKLLAAG